MENSIFTIQKDGLTFSMRVTPNAKTARVGGVVLDAKGRHILNVYVNVMPEDGKANEAVVTLLAHLWHLKRTHITLLKGFTNRNKVVHIAGDPTTLIAHIEKFL